MHTHRIAALAPLLLVAACSGGGGGGAPDFGQYELATLTTECEGFAGLTGQAILDAAPDSNMYATDLGYITAAGGRVDETALTMQLEWPAAPVATCYPAYEKEGTLPAGPRVAIEGVEFSFVTADGKFEESLDAKGWLTTGNGFLQQKIVLAVTTRGALDGSWEPFPDYEPISKNMSFSTALSGSSSTLTSGLVGGGLPDRDEYDAAIFGSQFVMATW